MDIGVLKESTPQEKRVAITPNVISKISKLGYKVLVETGLGQNASFSDLEYKSSGAIVSDVDDIWSCDIILKINKPTHDETDKLSKNQTLISFFSPSTHPDLLKQCSKENINPGNHINNSNISFSSCKKEKEFSVIYSPLIVEVNRLSSFEIQRFCRG